MAGGSASDPDSLIVYLAGERLNNEGDSFWGFELNQVAPTNFPKLAANQGSGDGTTFLLNFNRQLGDVLVSVSLQKGGTVPLIEVYEVTGFGANSEAIFTLAPTTCTGGTPVSQGQTNGTADVTAPPWNVLVCDPSGTNDSNSCRLVRGDGADNAVPPRDFIEVAVDLGQFDIAPACFNNVLFTSRSSSSVSADLKDVGGGTVPLCSASARTEIHGGTKVTDVANEPDIQGGSVSIGSIIHDKVFVSGSSIGTAPTPTGTVTFERFTNGTCTGTAAATETVTLSGGSAETSDFTTNAAGGLSYRATYNGDGDYPGGVVATCETLTVNKLPSTTTTAIHGGTQATDVANEPDIQGGSVNVGTIVHDQATVAGSGPTPTGSVTFSRYTNGTCDGTPAATQVVALSNGKAESDNFTTVAGSMSYKASYGGDDNYLASEESGCETLTVNKLSSTTTTAIHGGTQATDVANEPDIQGGSVNVGTIVHDQATVAGSGPTPTGSVTFSRYTNGTCDGTPAATQVVALSNGKAESDNFTTVAGSMSYKASYGGDDNYLASEESGCETLTAITPSTILDKKATIDSISVVVIYSYQEKNDGSVDLTMPEDGYVEDDKCSPVKIDGDDGDNELEATESWSGDEDGDGVLSAGETWDFTCTATLTSTGTHTNVALGHGIDPVGLDVTWCADTGTPPAGVRCDQDERDTTTVSISAQVTSQGEDALFVLTVE